MLVKVPIVHLLLLIVFHFMNLSPLIHSSTEEHLAWSHFGVIINITNMGILVQVFWWKYILLSFGLLLWNNRSAWPLNLVTNIFFTTFSGPPRGRHYNGIKSTKILLREGAERENGERTAEGWELSRVKSEFIWRIRRREVGWKNLRLSYSWRGFWQGYQGGTYSWRIIRNILMAPIHSAQ